MATGLLPTSLKLMRFNPKSFSVMKKELCTYCAQDARRPPSAHCSLATTVSSVVHLPCRGCSALFSLQHAARGVGAHAARVWGHMPPIFKMIFGVPFADPSAYAALSGPTKIVAPKAPKAKL